MEEKVSSSNVFNDLIPLFAVEIIILTLLNFANLSLVYRIMAIAIMAVAIMPIIKALPKNKTIIPLCLEVVTLLLYLLLSSCFGQIAYRDFLLSISVILGGLGFFTLGAYYGLFKDKKTSFANILSGIYIGLGLFSAISLIATIYGMGRAFHAIHFANPLYGAQNALIYQARIITNIFSDLDFTSAVPNQFGVALLGNFSLLAASGIYVTLFTDRKTNKFLWYGSLLGGLCGLSAIILIPIVFAMVFFIIGLVPCLLIRFKNKNTKYYLIAFGVLVLLLAGLYLFFRVDYHMHSEKYANMNYILKEFLMQQIGITRYTSGTKFMFENKVAFVGTLLPSDYTYVTSGNLLLDVLYQSGILPFIMIVAFFGLMVFEFIQYLKKDDELNIKVAVTSLAILFVITLLINYVGLLLIENFVFLGMLVVFGYVSTSSLKKINE